MYTPVRTTRYSMNLTVFLLFAPLCAFASLQTATTALRMFLDNLQNILDLEAQWPLFQTVGGTKADTLLESAKRARRLNEALYDRVIAHLKSKTNEITKFKTILKSLSKMSLSAEAVAKYGRDDIMLLTPGVMNHLPDFFDTVERVFKMDISKYRMTVCGTILSSKLGDQDGIDKFDKYFRDHFVMTDDQDSLRFAICTALEGIIHRSKKAIKLWNELYYRVVVVSKNENLLKHEMVKLYKEPRTTCLMTMMRNREPVNVVLGKLDGSAMDIVRTSSFKKCVKDQISTASYIPIYGHRFRDEIIRLVNDQKILPHPITGKLLLTTKLEGDELREVIKMFKVMVCLCIQIPNLALTENEYQTANDIEGQGTFRYDSRLGDELLQVTRDISSIQFTHIDCFDFGMKTAMNSLLQSSQEFALQVEFMIAGNVIDSANCQAKVVETDDYMLQIVRGVAESVIIFNPNLTEKEYKYLLENVKVLGKGQKTTFTATLDGFNGATSTPISTSTTTTTTTTTVINVAQPSVSAYSHNVDSYLRVCNQMFTLECDWSDCERMTPGKCEGKWQKASEERKTVVNMFKSKLSMCPAKNMVPYFKRLSEVSFWKAAVDKYRSNSVKLADAAFLDKLPTFFSHIISLFGIQSPAHRFKLYDLIYSSPLADTKMDKLDADFCAVYIDMAAHAQKAIQILIRGLGHKSKKCAEFWRRLYDNIANKQEQGLEGFMRNMVDHQSQIFTPIFKNRQAVNVKFDMKHSSVPELLNSASFVKVTPKEIDTVPYSFFFGPLFDYHIQTWCKEGKLASHPITGKLLLTNELSKSEANNVIKLFKMMICLNILIPRLALCKEEYESANQIVSRRKFVYYKELNQGLSLVAKDIEVSFENADLRGIVPEMETFNQALQRYPHLSHQVKFMISGDSLGLNAVRGFSTECTDGKKMIILGQPIPKIVINPKWTLEECKSLLESMRIERDSNNVVSYVAELPQTVTDPQPVAPAAVVNLTVSIPGPMNDAQLEESKMDSIAVSTSNSSAREQTRMMENSKVVSKDSSANSAEVCKSSEDLKSMSGSMEGAKKAKIDYKMIDFSLEELLNRTKALAKQSLTDSPVNKLLKTVNQVADVDPMVSDLTNRMAQVEYKMDFDFLIPELISAGIVKIQLDEKHAQNPQVKEAYDRMMQVVQKENSKADL